MGHPGKTDEIRCDVLDELEAAITTKTTIRVHLEDGSHRMGMPKDLYTEAGEDFLQLESHLPIPVSLIVRVEKS